MQQTVNLPLILAACGLVIAPNCPAAGLAEPEPAYFRSGLLDFESRVWAQAQIERVFHGHRIWPQENQTPKPPFATLVPAALIEEKAAAPLRMSAALQQFWNVEITAEMLQAEMDRMARDSKDRNTLHELFAALHHDPFLIAETLARGTLAERLLRNHYALDNGLHAEARLRAEAIALQVSSGVHWPGLHESYARRRVEREADAAATRVGAPGRGTADVIRLPEGEFAALHERLGNNNAGTFREDESGFWFEREMSANSRGLETEALFIAKRSFDEWWAGAAPEAGQGRERISAPRKVFRLPAPDLVTAGGCDVWDGAMRQPPPLGRFGHSAVWTGNEMIVWGGYEYISGYSRAGGRYTPATDLWQATSLGANAPARRYYHTAVWTGTVMIVWGGNGGPYFNTGGRYDPATDSWLTTSIGANVPSARFDHTMVWTGGEMIVWGGYDGTYSNTGGRYNAGADSWLATSLGANVPAGRQTHSAVWTGSEMIVWGGYSGGPPVFHNTGGRYNPAVDSWLPISLGANVPDGRQSHTAAWTGSEMIVWGGYNSIAMLNTGGRYNPATDSWLPTSIGTNVPALRFLHSAVWNGNVMIVWGGQGNSGYLNSGGRYNPATDSWLPTSMGVSVPDDRINHSAVWTGTEMIVWGGQRSGGIYVNTGGRYNPVADSWTATFAGAQIPLGRFQHSAIWTGSEMIVWGGIYSGSYLSTGGRYYPATDSWLSTAAGANLPSARVKHTAVWTGSVMLVWGGQGPGGIVNTGGRYDPAAGSWLTTSVGANVPAARSEHTGVWTGSEMIIWGGIDITNSFLLNNGGRYNPVTDNWLTTGTGANVPEIRYKHTATWTGSAMIIWGGYGSTYLNSGGRYTPASDSWLPTSIGTNVPPARWDHTATWTGSAMIIWGGNDGINLNSGGRYNPATDSWLPTSSAAAVPTARQYHTAVWTGSAMIIWGGYGGVNFNSGGRYNPATDTWLTTSTGANVPAARYYHTANWTGGAMIVWGGYNNGVSLDTGGIYTLDAPGPLGSSLRAVKSGSLVLNWNAATSAVSYNVKRCTTACTPVTIIASPTAPTTSYSEALNATSYFYAVEAVNACGVTP